MAGLVNAVRSSGTPGRPAAGGAGATAVGDAAATTNPAHSRGCTLAAVHAVAVADAVAEHRDPLDLAEACAAVVERDQRPWVDRLGRAGRAAPRPLAAGGAAGGARAVAPGRLSNGEAYVAAQHDAYAWRRFTRLQQLFDRPDDVLADPARRGPGAGGAGRRPRAAPPWRRRPTPSSGDPAVAAASSASAEPSSSRGAAVA